MSDFEYQHEMANRRSAAAFRQRLTDRVAAMLAINEQSNRLAEQELLTFGLEAAERLTQSDMGFLHFVNDDQETLELVTWTTGALTHCTAAHDSHYSLSQAGIWAACFHTRHPLVCNDYATALGRKGTPAGHVEMKRLISIPVIESDKVRMILGVGNKDIDYGEFDVDTLQLIGSSLWHIVHSARVERALATSLEKVKTILDNVSEAIFLHDENGIILEVNASAIEMYGYSRAGLLNLCFDDLFENAHPHFKVEVQAALTSVRSGVPQDFEWQARRLGGELFWVDGSVRLVSIGGQAFLLTVVRDITERKRLQEASDAYVRDLVALNKRLEDAHIKVIQTEKMASIGQLAAGVAHEINNPVGYVISNLSSLEKYLRDFVTMLDAYQRAEPAMEVETRDTLRRLRDGMDIDYLKQDVVSLLAESREGVNRVRRIVQDLKDFSRGGADDEWQWADIRGGLDSTLNIVWNELKYKTTVEKVYSDLPQIYCLPSQLNQVFMNLLVNAAHAIEDKGVVILRTGQESEMVWVEVEDNGVGISPENLTRIFDPFFTTKPVGKGTGLGLSVSYSIVQKHQGHIDVKSEVGKGTVFRVWLPIKPVVDNNLA